MRARHAGSAPATPFDADEGFHGRARRAPGREGRQFTLGEVTPDQKPPGPCSSRAIDVIISFKIGEFEIGRAVKTLALGAFARRQALPCPPAALFHHSRDRRGEHPQALLASWSGIF